MKTQSSLSTHLIAINAKFIHTNLAVRYLKSACDTKNLENVYINEYSINMQTENILIDIMSSSPDIIAFSCYIWNIKIVCELIKDIKKINPQIKIILGGPEVSADFDYLFNENNVDFIIIGEGEEIFPKLIESLIFNLSFENIESIVFKNDKNEIVKTKTADKGCDLKKITSPYVGNFNLKEYENKIIYYETSRGCPFNCGYCLSSMTKGVRFFDDEKVFNDLKMFIDNSVKQVKFIDRTFNSNKNHAMKIWRFLSENDNLISNFHFEISADLIDDEMIDFLKTVRTGLFQFEIGVQSSNLDTLNKVKRKSSLEKLVLVTQKLNASKNIHLHLDLIAGLPGENYESFKKSYNFVFSLNPDQLQLGFLKLLKGSDLKNNAKKMELVYSDNPPYEILSTADLSFFEICRLKKIADLTEKYLNSHMFDNSVKFLMRKFETPFDMFEKMSDFFDKMNYFEINHSKFSLAEKIIGFSVDLKLTGAESEILKEILTHDLLLRENLRTMPSFLTYEIAKDERKKETDFYENIEIIQYCEKIGISNRTFAKSSKIKKYYHNFTDYSYKISYFLYDYTMRDFNNNIKVSEIKI